MVSAVAISLILGYAAARDVATRIIPDHASLLIAGIALAGHLVAGTSVQAILVSIGLALLLFLVLAFFAIRGWLGGGDVKLAAAVALALTPAGLFDFIFATTMVGGVLGLGYIAGRRLSPRPRIAAAGGALGRILAIEAWRLRRGGPLPYGVAIAAGGALVLLTGA